VLSLNRYIVASEDVNKVVTFKDAFTDESLNEPQSQPSGRVTGDTSNCRRCVLRYWRRAFLDQHPLGIELVLSVTMLVAFHAAYAAYVVGAHVIPIR
jgi:hypothetical protein